MIHAECVVVKVELVAEWPDIVLPFPPNDEISKLGEAVFQRILWWRIDIVVGSEQFSSQTVDTEITKSASDTTKIFLPSKVLESTGAPKNNAHVIPSKEPAGTPQSAPNTFAAKSAPIIAAPKSAPITTTLKNAAYNGASADKNVAANNGTQKGTCEVSKKQQPIKRSKEAAGKKQPLTSRIFQEC